jgi:hypothetical protein
MRSPKAEKVLREVMEKNPNEDVQGQARIGLATNLKDKADRSDDLALADSEKLYAEAEKLLEPISAAADNPKIPNAMRDNAAKILAEIKKFGVGKVVPEIEAEDIDSKKFKLSDYRGKVVLLDFWGNW